MKDTKNMKGMAPIFCRVLFVVIPQPLEGDEIGV